MSNNRKVNYRSSQGAREGRMPEMPDKRSSDAHGKRPLIFAVAAAVVVIVLAVVAAFTILNGEDEQPNTTNVSQAIEHTAEEIENAKAATEEQPNEPSWGIDANEEGEEPVASEQEGSNSESSIVNNGKASVIAHKSDDRLKTSNSTNNVTPVPKTAYLTFDDGPSGQTEKILDTLDKYGIKATWFVCAYPGMLDKVSKIWERGHQVGLHSYSHNYDSIYGSSAGFFNDIDKLSSAVEGYIGGKPTVFRFPAGSVSSYSSNILSQLKSGLSARGLHYFDWNVTIGDSTPTMAEVDYLVNNIRNGISGKHSACVLMHDADSKSSTADALEQVIELLIAEDFSFDYLTADSFSYSF